MEISSPRIDAEKWIAISQNHLSFRINGVKLLAVIYIGTTFTCNFPVCKLPLRNNFKNNFDKAR